MLSSLLSNLFRVAFVITVIAGVINIIVEIKQSPIYLRKTETGYSSLGQPGILVSAYQVSNNNARRVPDTIVRYHQATGPNSQSILEFPLSAKSSFYGKKELNKIAAGQKTGEYIVIDSQIIIIRQEEWNWSNAGYSAEHLESLANGEVITKREKFNNDSKIMEKPLIDTFPDTLSAMIFLQLHSKDTRLKMLEETTVQKLRIMPEGLMQKIFFAFYVAINLSSIAISMLMLSILFRNFHKADYFTISNTRILMNLGWLLLIPEIIQTILYWLFLFKIHPAKITASTATKEIKFVNQYEILSGLDFKMIFLGLGILVLSYIFKQALQLKQEQELTI